MSSALAEERHKPKFPIILLHSHSLATEVLQKRGESTVTPAMPVLLQPELICESGLN